MADSASDPDVFDLERIRHLIALMQEHDLSEVDLRQGETRIQLRRGGEPVVSGPSMPAMIAASSTPAPGAVPSGKGDGAGDSSHLATIASPMVGTFYAAADPESPPYVKVGDHIGPETTVCIVEAMKILNHIPAEVSGRIVSILVENGEPVEYGQRLFEVDVRE